MGEKMAPTLVSIQVGKPQTHAAETKKEWESGIFKSTVNGPIWLGQLNLVGDGQQDLSVHGGPFRAVLAYSADYYPTWRETLGIPNFGYGAFGENFTISGLNETQVCLGDIYQIGEAMVQASQPRQPCWKLARRWGQKKLTALVEQSNRGGWYFRVLTEGHVDAGQPVVLQQRTMSAYPMARVNALIKEWEEPGEIGAAYAELAAAEALTPSWRAYFAERANQTSQP